MNNFQYPYFETSMISKPLQIYNNTTENYKTSLINSKEEFILLEGILDH